jgi:DNA polymerase III epsilon subunit family exonuclease
VARERYAVVDVETTGFSPVNDRIVEVACVCVDGDRIVDRWATLVDPQTPIPARATEIHGITDAMVAGAPTIDRALGNLRRLCAARTFVAHSARFDLSFLQSLRSPRAICTLRLARALFPDAPNHKNQTLRKVLEIDRIVGEDLTAHRALGDALVTAHVLIACRSRFSRRYWGTSWRRFVSEEALVS